MRAFLSRLYAFAFITRYRRFLKYPLARWIKLGAWVLVIAVWLLGGGTAGLMVTVTLAIGVHLLYYFARRAGYVTFEPLNPGRLPNTLPALPNNKHVKLRATGTFSVQNRSRYVVMLKADCWRVPLGDHIIMVEHPPGRYLYQFVEPDDFVGGRLGHLYLGPEPQKAVEIVFYTDWPSEDRGFAYYVRGKGYRPPSKIKRKVYLTFENEADWLAVWRSFATLREK